MQRPVLGSACCLLASVVLAASPLDQIGTHNVPEKSSIPAEAVELPLLLRNGVPAVEAKINGQGPFVLLVDTCGMGTVHPDDDLSRKLELPVVGQVEASDGSGGATRQLDAIRVDRLELGGAVFEGMIGPTHDYAREGGRDKVDGALGIHTFAEGLVTIDFPQRKLRIERGELPPADGKEVFDLVDSESLPMIDWKLAGDEPVRTHVDTGNMGGLAVSPQVAERLKFAGELQTIGEARTITSRSAVKQGRLSDVLRLGKHAFAQPQVSVMDFVPGANLGSEWLQHFAVTVDLRNARLRLARAGEEPIAAAPRYVVGVLLRRENESLVVDQVVPGGAAEEAGIRTGDVVLEIGGASTAELDGAGVKAALARPQPVTLKIERDGKPQEITLTPRKVE